MTSINVPPIAQESSKPSSSKSSNNDNSTTYMMTSNAQGTSLSPTPQYSSNNEIRNEIGYSDTSWQRVKRRRSSSGTQTSLQLSLKNDCILTYKKRFILI